MTTELIKATQLQQQAARLGFDWDNVQSIFEKLMEEVAELKVEINENNQAAMADELGDVLFTVVNIARFLHIDAEKALATANYKFMQRFSAMQALASERNQVFEQLTLAQMMQLWDVCKKQVIK